MPKKIVQPKAWLTTETSKWRSTVSHEARRSDQRNGVGVRFTSGRCAALRSWSSSAAVSCASPTLVRTLAAHSCARRPTLPRRADGDRYSSAAAACSGRARDILIRAVLLAAFALLPSRCRALARTVARTPRARRDKTRGPFGYRPGGTSRVPPSSCVFDTLAPAR